MRAAEVNMPAAGSLPRRASKTEYGGKAIPRFPFHAAVRRSAAADAAGAEAREARSRYDAAAAKVTDKKVMLEAIDNCRNTYPVIKVSHDPQGKGQAEVLCRA